MPECEECNDEGVVSCGRCGDGPADPECPACLGDGIVLCPERCPATEDTA